MTRLFAIAAMSLVVTAANASLVITGIVDGSLSGGLPKAVEIYALTDIADLSLYGFGSANNGGGSDGEEFTFSGSASAGDFIYVASESTQFTNYFGFAPTFTTGAASINGDDAVELFFSGNVIDVYGDINTNGDGEVWDYTDSWAYRADETGPDGATFTSSSWTYAGINALDGVADNSAAGIPLGSYMPAIVAIPEPTAALFGSLLAGALGMTVSRRPSCRS